jgi:hypothetical protein
MADTVECSNCGLVLNEDPRRNPETQKPCPNCGSAAWKFLMRLQGRITAKAELRGTLTVFSSTSLLLQSVIVPGTKTVEGQLIEAVALPWFEIIELLKNDPTIAYKLPPRKWEEILNRSTGDWHSEVLV